jgi:uncharacterized protein YtpQ (UPF0354 family)
MVAHCDYRSPVHVTSTTFLPLLARAAPDPYGDPAAPVLEEFAPSADLAIAYSFGPPYGERLVSWLDIDSLGLDRRVLRTEAAANLDALAETARLRGQPPARMLSFDGLESSLLLADAVWSRLAAEVDGDVVVGVPARDVVVVTGSAWPDGVAQATGTVERIFSAGDQHLLTDQLLVRREGGWRRFTPRIPAQRQA